MLFSVHSLHKGWMKIPCDEIEQLMASDKVQTPLLEKDKKIYRCHQMNIEGYDELRQNHEKIRKIYGGKTNRLEYSIGNIFLDDDSVSQLQINSLQDRKNNLQSYHDLDMVLKETNENLYTEGSNINPTDYIGIKDLVAVFGWSWNTIKTYAAKAGVEIRRKTPGDTNSAPVLSDAEILKIRAARGKK
jgi:hypothetical protein